MARFVYFADLPNGEVLEWSDRREKFGEDRMGCALYREVTAKVGMFLPTANPAAGNKLCGYHPELGRVEITRKVILKVSPSRHDCDARCMNASGRNMACECSCGGKNHGRGAFVCEAA